MSAITTHVLDTARGRPAAGVPIVLEHQAAAGWLTVGRGVTDDDGRLRSLLPPGEPPAPGTYRISFDTAAYFTAAGVSGFFPAVHITFVVADPAQHYHVPLLLSPFGYSTYRGS